MNWLKKNGATIGLVFILIVGAILLLYPSVSDYWNSFHQSKAIAVYAETVDSLDEKAIENMLQEAAIYNEALLLKERHWILDEEEYENYKKILDTNGTGVIGSVEIPKINVSLPVYHGTEEEVLQTSIGHIEGSSFPIGGKGNHSVLSGHRGLPSAKLFSNLDELIEGDTFMVRVLGETLVYCVDQIRIVEPHELEELEFDPDRDLCTLVTCTPYGVNSHRLLVRGYRVENEEVPKLHVSADAVQIEPIVTAPVIAVPILLFAFLGTAWKDRRR